MLDQEDGDSIRRSPHGNERISQSEARGRPSQRCRVAAPHVGKYIRTASRSHGPPNHWGIESVSIRRLQLPPATGSVVGDDPLEHGRSGPSGNLLALPEGDGTGSLVRSVSQI